VANVNRFTTLFIMRFVKKRAMYGDEDSHPRRNALL